MAASFSSLSSLPPPPNPLLLLLLLPLTSQHPFSLLSPSSSYSQSPSVPPSLFLTPPSQQPLTRRPADLPFDLLSSVECPSSIAYANLVFFKDTFNIEIVGDPDDKPEDQEEMIGRFGKEVWGSGIITEIYRRKFFENKREEKIRKKKETQKEAAWLRGKRHPRKKKPVEEEGAFYGEEDDDEDGNWDFVDGEVPYC